MSTQVIKKDENSHLSVVENLLIKGDLSKMNEQERLTYYKKLCDSVGLNPLTQPFEYITMNGKLTLYTRKSATEQLRKLHGVSIEIVAREKVDDCYMVVARATDSTGRKDESIGSVNIKGMAGEALSNAIMKAETKAKRRVTLSICGLAFLDESEVSSLPSNHVTASVTPSQPAQNKALNGDKKPWEAAKPVEVKVVSQRKDYVIPAGTLEGVKLSEKSDDFWVNYRKELREKLQSMPDNFKNTALEIIKHLDDYLAE